MEPTIQKKDNNTYDSNQQVETLRLMLEDARKNPNTHRANELRKYIETGKYNFELKALGLEPVAMPQPKVNLQTALQSNNLDGGDLITASPKVGRFSDFSQDLGEGLEDLRQVAPDRGTKAGERIKTLASGVSDVFRPSSSLQERVQGFGDFGVGGFGTVAQGVGALFDTATIFGETLGKLFLHPDEEKGIKESLGVAYERALANPYVDQAVQFANEAKAILEEKDPEMARAFGDALILTEATGVGAVSRPVGVGVRAVGKTTGEIAKKTGQTIAQGGESLQQGLENTARTIGRSIDKRNVAQREKDLSIQKDKVRDAMGRLTQAGSDKKLITAASESLRNIDLTDVKSYAELNIKQRDRIKAVGTVQDELLEEYSDFLYLPDGVAKITKVGDVEVVENPILDALDGLEEAYSKSREFVKAQEVINLRDRFMSQGLTPREMNQIARDYNIEYYDRAFTKNGEAKQGYNAEAYENIRLGVKNQVADVIDNKKFRALDKEMYQIYSTLRATEKMEDKVAKKLQKMEDTGLLEKVGRAIGVGVNAGTFGTVRGFLSQFLPRSFTTDNTLDVVQIEQRLQKYLKELEKIEELEKTNPKSAEIALTNLIKNAQSTKDTYEEANETPK